MTVTLVDPRTGRTVKVRTAQLDQTCPTCHEGMKGRTIVAVDDALGWACFAHLETRLAVALEVPRVEAARRIRRTLRETQPGETITVTRTLLVAMDAV